MGLTRPEDDQSYQSVGGSEVGYDQLRDQKKQNQSLRLKVDLLREQASINMKMALMKVPEKWQSSIDIKRQTNQTSNVKMFYTKTNSSDARCKKK